MTQPRSTNWEEVVTSFRGWKYGDANEGERTYQIADFEWIILLFVILTMIQ